MILIVNFGGQYTQLIRRAVNDVKVAAEIVDAFTLGNHMPTDAHGVILSGGPKSVHEEAQRIVEKILLWNLPTLGICFGHQLLAAMFGGTVSLQRSREYGRAMCRIVPKSSLTSDLVAREYPVWMSHGDSVTTVPPTADWRVVGNTPSGSNAIIVNEERRLYGVQFHPEVTQTECGPKIFENFVLHISRSPQDFRPGDLVAAITERIRSHVGSEGHILAACSFGVDSTTVARLCSEALGKERVHTVFINNGLQRAEDLELAERGHTFLPNLIVEDYENLFLTALEGISDPQEKRRIVGEQFWIAFRDVAQRLQAQHPIVAFTQGTLAPDVIESGADSAHAAVIKTHHNLVPPPADFPFPPLEPFRELYKDQVRAIAREISVPPEISRRHPFPGPGLAIRVSGPITRDRVRVARACDTAFTRAIRDAGLYDAVSQALVVVQEGQAVCVRGDARVRAWPVTLRAFWTRDFMTADTVNFSNSFLTDVSDKITNTIPEVACVSYNYTSKPPCTIEWE